MPETRDASCGTARESAVTSTNEFFHVSLTRAAGCRSSDTSPVRHCEERSDAAISIRLSYGRQGMQLTTESGDCRALRARNDNGRKRRRCEERSDAAISIRLSYGRQGTELTKKSGDCSALRARNDGWLSAQSFPLITGSPGNHRSTTTPPPSRLAMPMRPPWASTISRDSVSPRPVPERLVE